MASIKCGSCKGTHGSARAVKFCFESVGAYWTLGCAPGFMIGSYDQVISMDEAIAEMDEQAAQQAGEIWAEAGMSWVAGGGSPEDARLYASVIASGQTWDEYLHEQDVEFAKVAEAMGTCDHGLSAALCAGPGHYPADDPYDF